MKLLNCLQIPTKLKIDLIFANSVNGSINGQTYAKTTIILRNLSGYQGFLKNMDSSLKNSNKSKVYLFSILKISMNLMIFKMMTFKLRLYSLLSQLDQPCTK